MKALFPCLMAAGLAAAPVHAQSVEPIGEIRLTFQGEEIQFHTLHVIRATGDEETTATVGPLSRSHANGLVQVLSLTGSTGADSSGGVVMLTHYFDETPQAGTSGVFANDSSVSYFPDQRSTPFWVEPPDGNTNFSISFDRYEFDGARGHASGSFTGRVCLQDDRAAESDGSICEDVTGSFDTPITAGEN